MNKHRGKNWVKIIILTLFIVSLTATGLQAVLPVTASSATTWETALTKTGSYLYQQTAEPTTGSVGGDWKILGLSRYGLLKQNDKSCYYLNTCQYIQDTMKSNQTLSTTKSTEYSRVILGLTAVGADVTDVAGYNLLEGLTDMNFIKRQGVTGSVWALIALDSNGYQIPINKDTTQQVTREKLISAILMNVQDNGGWKFGRKTSAETADADMTSMAIQALAPYYNNNTEVQQAVDRGIEVLSELQETDGGYTFYQTKNAESDAQVIMALCTMGIDPLTDSRFQKNGKTVVDSLMRFYRTTGGFRHLTSGGVNQMATEQAYEALISLKRYEKKQTPIYQMSDATVNPTALNKVSLTRCSHVTAKSSVKKQAKLTWSQIKYATGYEIYQAGSKNGTYKKVKTVVGKNKVTQTLTINQSGKNIYYKIRAYRTCFGKKQYGAFSRIVAVKIR